ncbi:MAG TPA: efflux RND transporter periplasmic adaptor subunit [Bacteroidales bacterium]|nr:efflux RND transporter periplasmic adaptor subunit [Bacteroidales bacterium]
MQNRNITHTITCLILAGLLAACTGSGNGSNKNAAEKTEMLPEDIVEMRSDQIKLAGVDTSRVEQRDLFSTIKVNGKVAVPPQNFVSVSAPLGGFIKSTSLIPGSSVSKGQTLALVENQEFVNIEESYLETKNKLEYAEAEFKRHTELFKEDVYSEKNLQQVTTEYRTLKVQLSALEQKLALIGLDPSTLKEDNISRSVALVSPINGFVRAVNVNNGKSISPTDVLFEVVNTEMLYLELSLFEKDASKVEKGQKVRFFINNETEGHDAEIYQTARSVNEDKTYKVYALVHSGCRNVLPGMYVNAVVELSGKNVTAVPSDAVVSFDDKEYIFVFVRNKEEKGNAMTEYRMVQVTKGVSEDGFTEIGLPEGFDLKTLKVVVKGAYNLLSAKKNAGEMAC